MHELSLIKKVVDNAQEAAERAGIKSVSIIRMRVGKMTGLTPDQLGFLFETYDKAACLKDSKLEIEEVPVELSCQSCKYIFRDDRFDDHSFAHSISHTPSVYTPPACPKCGNDNTQIKKGRELELINLEGE